MTTWIFPPAGSAAGTERSPAEVLSIAVEMREQVTVVTLEGPVCAYTAGHLDTQLSALVDAGRHRIVIDATRVRPLCSDGVEVLLVHEQRCAEAGGELVVRNPRPSTRRVLDILELEPLLIGVSHGSSG